MRIKRFFKKIEKICSYLPILWEDEDWDFEYILLLLKHKLKRVSRCIKDNDIIAKHEQREIFIGINQTIYHIDNFLKGSLAFEEIEGRLPFETKFVTEHLNNGCTRLHVYHAKENRPLTEEEEKTYDDYIMKSYEFENKEWNAIFDTLKSECGKWWD